VTCHAYALHQKSAQVLLTGRAFILKFRSADDCVAGAKYFQQVLAKNTSIEVLPVRILDKEALDSSDANSPPFKSIPEETAVQNAAYALPLQRLFAASPTQWPN